MWKALLKGSCVYTCVVGVESGAGSRLVFKIICVVDCATSPPLKCPSTSKEGGGGGGGGG
eukprot:SAG31_NODE_27626_length_423_cov_0.552469_1_plen_59_part_10